MIDINVTLLIQVVNLFVLIWLLNTVLYRPIRNMVAQRNQVMSAKRQDIALADGEAASAVRHFEEKIHEARAAGRQKVQENKDAAYQQEKGLLQISDEAALAETIERILSQHPNEVAEFRQGKDKLLGFFVGQAMKETKGKGNPKLLNELLLRRLKGE